METIGAEEDLWYAAGGCSSLFHALSLYLIANPPGFPFFREPFTPPHASLNSFSLFKRASCEYHQFFRTSFHRNYCIYYLQYPQMQGFHLD